MNFVKGLKYCFAAACAVGILAGAQGANAQNLDFAAAGSSAMFATFATSTYSTLSGGTVKVYSSSTGASVRETVGGVNYDTGATIWVIVNTKGTASTADDDIYTYFSVDSTVGVRSFFNNATIVIDKASLKTTPDQSFTGITTQVNKTDADIDAALTFLNGKSFNAGMTDITPADAQFQTLLAQDVNHNYSATVPIEGYGSNGTAVATSKVRVVNFSLGSRAFTLTPVGASPIMVVVNKNNPTGAADSTGHFSDSTFTNINRFVLSGYLDGTFKRTRSAFPVAPNTLGDFPVITFLREMISGTYTTMENCIPASAEIGSTQESGATSDASTNPLNEANYVQDFAGANTADTAGRVRVIGTGASVKHAQNNAATDTLAYAFWSFSNFSSTNSTKLKYVTVDGVDPIQDSYSNGSLQVAASSVTFKNILNGTYPIWSLLRAVVATNVSSTVTSIIGAATTSANGSNFVPKNQLFVFRSHYGPTFEASPNNDPRNGNVNVASGKKETGRDAGGAVFPIQADVDYSNDFGGFQLTGFRQ